MKCRSKKISNWLTLINNVKKQSAQISLEKALFLILYSNFVKKIMLFS